MKQLNNYLSTASILNKDDIHSSAYTELQKNGAAQSKAHRWKGTWKWGDRIKSTLKKINRKWN